MQWVPHGINENTFFPIEEGHAQYDEFVKFKDDFQKKHNTEFIVFWNNRNIRRKQPGDLILAFNEFCKRLPEAQAKKCALLLHTQPVDGNGTDLFAVKML